MIKLIRIDKEHNQVDDGVIEGVDIIYDNNLHFDLSKLSTRIRLPWN